jgi:hypothetical protein
MHQFKRMLENEWKFTRTTTPWSTEHSNEESKTIKMNYVRRRLSSSTNNVSNMRLEGRWKYLYKYCRLQLSPRPPSLRENNLKINKWFNSVEHWKQCFGSVFIFPDPDPDPEVEAGDQYGSAQGFNDQKLKKNNSWKKIKFFFDQKLQFTYP